VLDLLKPHEVENVEFARAIADVEGVDGVNVGLAASGVRSVREIERAEKLAELKRVEEKIRAELGDCRDPDRRRRDRRRGDQRRVARMRPSASSSPRRFTSAVRTRTA